MSKGKRLTKHRDKTDNVCMYCLEKHSCTSSEPWVQCVKCQQWAHDECTSGEDLEQFLCDLCQNLE